MAEILELKNMCKYCGSLAASKDINPKVKKGTVHAAVNENGAGKSTLINTITGVNQSTSEEIFPNDKKVSFQDTSDANQAGIGMVQREFMPLDKLSVLDNIIMGYEDTKRGLSINKKESSEEIKNICEEYGFHFSLNTLVRDLPVAVRWQVEIVEVLFRKADIIILDEPTAVLPYQGIQRLLKAIRYLVSQGKTVVFIMHKLKEVSGISDTITVIKGGTISGKIGAGGATELALTNMMVGRDVVLKLDRQSGHSEKEVLSVGNLMVKDDRKITRVKDISSCLRKGEILGTVGVSGNGQNELVETITGMRGYETGTICPHRERLPVGTPRNNRLKRIDYVPQDRINVGSSVDSNLVENCIMGYYLNRLRKEENLMDYRGVESFTNSIIEGYNMKTHFSKDRAGSLSGGNLQKLITGREFSQSHKVLPIEDPTRRIDIGSTEFIWKEIQKQVGKEDVLVILIAYNLTKAMTLSNRILVMYDGYINRELIGPDYDEKGIGMCMTGGGSDRR